MSLTKLESLDVVYDDKEDGQTIDPSEWNSNFYTIETKFNSNKDKINAMIDALESVSDGSSGADCIGATSISGVVGSTIQSILESIKSILDTKYSSDATDDLLDLKADLSVTNNHIKTVSYDSSNGKFTFTTENGTQTIVDTMLEKIITNFAYDEDTQSLVFTASDGTTSSVSISDFITVNEFQDSNQVDFTVNDGVVTATIKSGSITFDMLDSAVSSTLIGYKNEAQTYANNAYVSETNSLQNKNDAELAKSQAIEAKNDSIVARDRALSAANSSELNKVACGEYSRTASTHSLNAGHYSAVSEDYSKDAEAWSSGTRGGVDVSTTDPAYNNNAKYWKNQAQAQAGDKLPVSGGTLTGLLTLYTDPVSNLDAVTKQYADTKVEKVSGKSLSTNDYTTDEKNKVSNLPSNTNTSLANKVDKISGKGLSTNDYTTADKNKVANIPADTNSELDNKVNAVSGKGLSTNDYTTEEKTKLSGIATNATKNTTIDYAGTISSTNWLGEAPLFMKEVSVNGILETDTPILDIVTTMDSTTAQTECEEWGKIFKAVAGENAIMFIANDMPTISLNFVAKVVR